MSAASFEFVLARLYTDAEFLNRFKNSPLELLDGVDLTSDEKNKLLEIDKTGLELAARSFRKKRETHSCRKPKKD